jgi:hypothetical protein
MKVKDGTIITYGEMHHYFGLIVMLLEMLLGLISIIMRIQPTMIRLFLVFLDRLLYNQFLRDFTYFACYNNWFLHVSSSLFDYASLLRNRRDLTGSN